MDGRIHRLNTTPQPRSLAIDALPTANGSRPWSVCNDAISLPDDHPFSMLPTLAGLLEAGYQVLLYNGENDLSWCVAVALVCLWRLIGEGSIACAH